MRYNEKELKQWATTKQPTIQGVLQYMKPQGDWSDWYQQPVFKERFFKLIHNFLFYYRASEPDEPIGVFLLEQMQVAYESPGPAFAFSITFSDGKHLFACRCQEDLNKWVAALKESSYSYWKSMYQVLQIKLARHKQMQNRAIECTNANSNNGSKMNSSIETNGSTSAGTRNANDIQYITKKMYQSTFYSQSESHSTSTKTSIKCEQNSSNFEIHNVPVGNLIDLS